MNGTWIMEVPARPVKVPVNIPVNEIERISAIMLFRAASGLGLYDCKQLIDINFPHHLQPQRNTLNMKMFRDFVTAWRNVKCWNEENLRGVV